MNRMRLALLIVAGCVLSVGRPEDAKAQFYGGIGYGSHHYSGFYAGYAGGYPLGAYPVSNWYMSPYRYVSPGYVGTYGNGVGYVTNYGIGYGLGTGTGYGIGYAPNYGVSGPVVVGANPVYGTTTTIIRGGPTGGVVNYSHNGNGYTYVPDSTYPTVIQQQPTLGLSRTIVPPMAPPVVVENRPPGNSATYGLNATSTTPFAPSTTRSPGMIKLVSPKTASGPLTYSLNGHVYSIQPGYSQSFRDDRAWTIEFKRGGEGSEIARYPLTAGTYTFGVGNSGWELQSGDAATVGVLPPAPLPPAPSPAANSTPSLPPTPLPPP